MLCTATAFAAVPDGLPSSATFSPGWDEPNTEDAYHLDSVNDTITVTFDKEIPDGYMALSMLVGGSGFAVMPTIEPLIVDGTVGTIVLNKDVWGNPYMGSYNLTMSIAFVDEEGDFVYDPDTEEPYMFEIFYTTENIFPAELVAQYPDDDWSYTSFDRAFDEGLYIAQYNNEVSFANNSNACRITYKFNNGDPNIIKRISYDPDYVPTEEDEFQPIELGWDTEGNYAISVYYGDSSIDVNDIESITITLYGLISKEESLGNHTIVLNNPNTDQTRSISKKANTASIDKLLIENNNDNISVYNIQGVKVSTVNNMNELKNLPKGLYIVNGTKFIIR